MDIDTNALAYRTRIEGCDSDYSYTSYGLVLRLLSNLLLMQLNYEVIEYISLQKWTDSYAVLTSL